MMRRSTPILTIVALCATLFFASCKQEDQTENVYEKLLGTYDLVLVTDSLSTDGEWVSNEWYGQVTGEPEPDMYGELTISMGADGESINLLGMVDLGDGERLPLYQTTARLNDDGELVIAPSEYTAPTGYLVRFSYGNAQNQQPLVFRSQMNVDMAGYDFGYIMTNTATKR